MCNAMFNDVQRCTSSQCSHNGRRPLSLDGEKLALYISPKWKLRMDRKDGRLSQIDSPSFVYLCVSAKWRLKLNMERERGYRPGYHKEMRFVHLLRISEKCRLERCMDRKENQVIRKFFKIKLILRKKSNLGNMQQVAWNHEKGFNLKKPDNLRQ